MGEHVPFDGGAGFHQVVLEDPGLEARDGQAGRVDHMVEGGELRAEVDAFRWRIDDAGMDGPIRMRGAQGLRQHQGAGEVAEGEAGVSGDAHAGYSGPACGSRVAVVPVAA